MQKKTAILLSTLFLTSSASMLSGCFVHYSYPNAGQSVDAVTKQVTLEAHNGEFESISIESSGEKAVVQVGGVDQVVISATLYGESMEGIDSFMAQNFRRSFDGSNLSLKLRPSFYRCQLLTFADGTRKVSGLCMGEIVVHVPEASRTRVYFNGQRVDRNSPMSVGDLLQSLDTASFKSDKADIVRTFAQSHINDGRYIGSAELEQVLSQFSFDDDKLMVLGHLSGHITDPAQAARLIEMFSFSSNKNEALQLLIR